MNKLKKDLLISDLDSFCESKRIVEFINQNYENIEE